MPDHTKLLVWQRAMALSTDIHHATQHISSRLVPGLRSQLIRAAASVPANIAEGAGYNSDAKFASFTSVAIGSTNEVETFLILARSLGVIDETTCLKLEADVREIRRLLFGLRRRLQSGDSSQRRRDG